MTVLERGGRGGSAPPLQDPRNVYFCQECWLNPGNYRPDKRMYLCRSCSAAAPKLCETCNERRPDITEHGYLICGRCRNEGRLS
jgi:hypothetical protein